MSNVSLVSASDVPAAFRSFSRGSYRSERSALAAARRFARSTDPGAPRTVYVVAIPADAFHEAHWLVGAPPVRYSLAIEGQTSRGFRWLLGVIRNRGGEVEPGPDGYGVGRIIVSGHPDTLSWLPDALRAGEAKLIAHSRMD